MNPIRHILVAVKNPDLREQRGVKKALHIAKRLGASVELFHAISSPVFLELEPLTGHTVAEIRREALALRGARLEKLAAGARRSHMKVSSHVAWDYPPHEAIERRAAAIHADLIIAECHQGRRLKPWLMHLTDWELLRVSRRPVLLLKNDRKWRDPVVLAAVDPAHAHAKPGRLDAGIVAQASSLSRATGGELQLLHANFPSGLALIAADAASDAAAMNVVYEDLKSFGKAQFEAFAAKHRVPRNRRHLLDSDPVFAIPHMARKLGADVVVMGAVSRSGLKRVFIGNTAERILGSLPCDVLVVKPGHFPARVERAARGMRLVASQPVAPLPF
jgi:universal stress protein E